MRITAPLAATLFFLTALPQAGAQVRVRIGPTPIPRGNARSDGEITVVNEWVTVETGAPRALHQ